MDTDHVQILLAIQKDVSETRGMVAEALKNSDEKIADINKRLDTADNRQWLKAMVIAPLMVVLHAGFRKLGVNV